MVAKSSNENSDVEVLESGNIYFCYRPKVQEKDNANEDVEGLQDVQRFYIVLRPTGKKVYRMLSVGQKHLPDTEHHGEQTWGFVDTVEKDARAIEKELQEKRYSTKTRGERVQPAARPAGEGTYELVNHGSHTHLVYALELPHKPGEAQRDLAIEDEGSYILQIKNPEQGAPKNVGLSDEQKADLPKSLQDHFDGRRFIGANPPDFLDYAGTEVLLIAASDNVYQELGLEIDADDETQRTADMIRDLHMRKSRHPIEPLFTGKWT